MDQESLTQSRLAGAAPDAVPAGAVEACDGPELQRALDELEEAFQTWDATAIRTARSSTRFAFVTALMGPIAVLLLTIQVLTMPEASPLAVAFIAAELALLLITLVVGFAPLGPSPDEWVHARLRAEILRRERYLICARVGPYLAPPDLCVAIRKRLLALTNTIADPLDYLSLQDEDRRPWRDALEEAGPGATLSPEPDCQDDFHRNRIADQLGWYKQKSHAHGHRHERLEVVARVILVLALVISGMHLMVLLYAPHDPTDLQLALELFVGIVAIVLPTVGAAATALQSLFQGRHVARLYRYQAEVLLDISTAFLDLKEQLIAGSLTRPDAELRLKRLVLRAEEVLAHEQRQWWMLMHS